MVNVISRDEKVNGVTYTTLKKTAKIAVTYGKWVCQVLEGDIIMFDNEDVDGLIIPHNDALVISLLVHDTNVKRVLIDQESTKRIIINNTKKQLKESKDRWPEVLPGVLWAYRTTTKISTGETPFSLIYGTEALIPVEIGEPSTRFEHTNEVSNEEELRTNLDLTEVRREVALIRMAVQKQRIERY
nr:uncharacterized protein LOC104096289 [Nicotiana tomentosiformis]